MNITPSYALNNFNTKPVLYLSLEITPISTIIDTIVEQRRLFQLNTDASTVRAIEEAHSLHRKKVTYFCKYYSEETDTLVTYITLFNLYFENTLLNNLARDNLVLHTNAMFGILDSLQTYKKVTQEWDDNYYLKGLYSLKPIFLHVIADSTVSKDSKKQLQKLAIYYIKQAQRIPAAETLYTAWKTLAASPQAETPTTEDLATLATTMFPLLPS